MMVNKLRICVVTGTRADYGLLYWLMKGIEKEPDLELKIVASGMHLSPQHGSTYRTIEHDGFVIEDKIEMLLSSDSSVGVGKSMGLGVIGAAEMFDRLKPDIVVLLGDRFEALSVAAAALVARVPVAHIAGGDTTEGAFDEAIRHSITKMSHIHFVTNEEAGRRVRQMGEDPINVHIVGSPGIDQIRQLNFLTKTEVERQLSFKFYERNLLITHHPATLGCDSSVREFQRVLDGLSRLGSKVGLIFTLPNDDPEGCELANMIKEYSHRHKNACVHASLGQLLYLSTMAYTDVVVGNSSSGLYEAPSFKKPTVNIGNRQKGRLQAKSVINCSANPEAIYQAIMCAFGLDCREVVNPYGDGYTSERIMDVLLSVDDPSALLHKHFHMLPTEVHQ